MPPVKVDQVALLTQAQHLDRLWDAWIMEGDSGFDALDAGMSALRQVLAGTRRARVHKSTLEFWHATCQCGWHDPSSWADTRTGYYPGSLGCTDGRPGEKVTSGREMALRVYARHTCNQGEQ